METSKQIIFSLEEISKKDLNKAIDLIDNGIVSYKEVKGFMEFYNNFNF
jgi:uncharacterized UPF0160 family protein